MKKISSYLGIITILLLVSACGTSVKYKIEHPPKIVMGKINTVKLNKFQVNGNLDLVYQQHQKILSDLLNFAESRISESAGNKAIKQYMFSNFLHKLANNKFYNITENAYNYEAVIKGDISYSVDDDYNKNKKKVKKKDKDGKTKTVTTYSYYIQREAAVTINMRVNDKSGKVLGAARVTASAEDQITENSLEAALDNIETWESLVNQALNKTLTPLSHKLIPYYTYEHLSLKTGHSKRIKSANKKAKKGKWHTALKVWKQKKENGKKEERVASLYNIAIYYEVHDDLDKSISLFRKLNRLTSSTDFDDDIGRINKRKQEKKLLSEEPSPKEK